MDKNKTPGRQKAKGIEQVTEIIADHDAELLAYLVECFPEKRKKLKAVLAAGQIEVNGKRSTQFNQSLAKGDRIRIAWSPDQAGPLERLGILVISEDEEFIAVEKPAGMLSVATDSDNIHTVYRHVNQYIKRNDPKQRIFVIHRLDQDTSGVMVFARTQQMKELLQADWNQLVTERIYYGVVEGVPAEKKGLMDHFLFEDKQKMVHISHSGGKGKRAVTSYEVEESGSGYSLIRFSLQSGRKNQIRVQMSELGHPILGDDKYGSKHNPLNRLTLHAHRLTLNHPVSGRVLTFQSSVPPEFLRLVRQGR
jgi:23S rRNA pseudouridine1911/1915/1917 synthase